MSGDNVKVVAQRFYDSINSGTALASLDQLLTADFVDHNRRAGMPDGPDGVRLVLEHYRASVTDLKISPQDLISEGDKVAARVELTCTHSGTFMGIPPTGKQVVASMVEILKIRDGKIAERWGFWDEERVLAQLRSAG